MQFGAAGLTRTGDLLITNQLLYQLSYSSSGAHYKRPLVGPLNLLLTWIANFGLLPRPRRAKLRAASDNSVTAQRPMHMFADDCRLVGFATAKRLNNRRRCLRVS